MFKATVQRTISIHNVKNYHVKIEIIDYYSELQVIRDLAPRSSLEFLHCTPVGRKPGSYMPNMAVPDLNKI